MIYNLCKKQITSGNYVYDDMLNKLDVYLLGNRITSAQYNELKSLMGTQKETSE